MERHTVRHLSEPMEAYRFTGEDLRDVEWLLDELTSHGGEAARPLLGITSEGGEPRLFLRTTGAFPKLVMPGMWVLISTPVGRWDAVSDEQFRRSYEVLR